MKKFLTLAFALFLSISVSAQTTLTEAVNFTSTAHNGEKIDLFEILDGGQYVLIDFFFSTCVPCKETTPRLIDAYYMLGCNEGDIYFMEVSPTDNNASYSIGQWFAQFDVPFPTIHTQTGGVTGDKIEQMYGITAHPTLILIAPDRKIVLQDYFPQSASSMVEYFTTNFDIEESYCGNQTPSVSVVTTKVDGATGKDILEASTKVHVDFRANGAVDKFYYTISESAQLTSEEVIANGTLAESSEFSYTFEGLTESTKYYVYAQAIGHDGENGEKSVLETKTLCPGDDGKVEFTFDIQISASHLVAKATPNESTADYHFGFTRKEYYDEGADAGFPTENQFIFLNALANDGYPFCDAETYELPLKDENGTPRFQPNTPYYIVAIGRNGEGQWFAPTLQEFVVEQPIGPAEVSLNVKPLATSVTVSATPNDFTVEFHFGVVTKTTYDTFGAESLVQQIRNDGYPFYQASESTWDNLTPNTEYVALGTALNAGNEWGETAIVTFSTDADGLVETEAGFNIYPNPAQSMISIKSAMNGEAQISIFDMTGRCVKQVSATDMSNVSINVEGLNKGVYFVSVQQDRNHNIQKLVIE